MIALQTYAHHIDTPAYSSGNGVQVSASDNWVLGAPREVTIFIVEPEHFGSRWKRSLTLHFPFNSDQLTSKQIKEIEALPASAHYRIVGSASYPGSDRYNYQLGLRRSQAVARVLKTEHNKAVIALVSWGNAFASPNKSRFPMDQKAVVQIPGR